MAELHLKGYLTKDSDGIIALSNIKKDENSFSWINHANSIIDDIHKFAEEYGLFGGINKGLGGYRSIIDDCNLRIYFTDKECELEEAMEAFDVLMYGGDLRTKTYFCGYSEYTIIGIDLDEFAIGGHDLASELSDHLNEYCHIIIEV